MASGVSKRLMKERHSSRMKRERNVWWNKENMLQQWKGFKSCKDKIRNIARV